MRRDVERVVFDFDGTLAQRPGMWTKTIVDVLAEHFPRDRIPIDRVRPHLERGFPWHEPEEPHEHLNDPDAWWANLSPVLGAALLAGGADHDSLDHLLRATRHHYCDASRFLLYDDTLPVLRRLKSEGIGVTILSNHVPELPAIVRALGISTWVDDVFTSAAIGYEKPHPRAFAIALAGSEPSRCWMIGDNATVDINGALGVGMHALLVRHDDAPYLSVEDAIEHLLALPPVRRP